VEVDVGVDGFSKIVKVWVYRVRHKLPGNHTC
jgi:hypothetical protein